MVHKVSSIIAHKAHPRGKINSIKRTSARDTVKNTSKGT